MLPFTTEQFLDVFAGYNTAIWPAPLVAELLGLSVVLLLLRRPPGAGRSISAILAVMWLLMGLGYHLAFFAAINPAAYGFAALFVVQGALFSVEGVWRGRVVFAASATAWRIPAAILMAYALVAYPLVGLLGDHPYPATPLFGVAPCPTVIFTLALLMLTRHPRPLLLATIPLLWSLIGGSAAVFLGVPQDGGLIAAGALLAIRLSVKRHLTGV